MTYRSEFGQLGENIACRYLVEKNYKIIERNHRQKWGEIDIIAKAPDKTLVFVEVKTVKNVSRETNNQISAEDQLTAAKLEKIKRTASLYAGHNQDMVDEDKGWRIDLLALTISGNHFEIKHYENI
ncbi:YraN family protein [Candidatus Wolfebacteria bacterium]|nr:YraN family protein [Candidatus Wolfebacteria bacterium]